MSPVEILKPNKNKRLYQLKKQKVVESFTRLLLLLLLLLLLSFIRTQNH